MSNEHARATEADSPPKPDATAGAAAARRSTSPLITVVELENFKGIGRPVRIDLRPLTLLFGPDSAGKSTVLHALCHAHEILSHRNVDAGKVELGGDQIDLGGFRRLVHAHDLGREVRLRFDLNLENRRERPPEGASCKGPVGSLADKLDFAEAGPVPADFLLRSGWIEIAVTWSRPDAKPVLASYEVGINESLVGRIRPDAACLPLADSTWRFPRLPRTLPADGSRRLQAGQGARRGARRGAAGRTSRRTGVEAHPRRLRRHEFLFRN